jgi:hypothetical protein
MEPDQRQGMANHGIPHPGHNAAHRCYRLKGPTKDLGESISLLAVGSAWLLQLAAVYVPPLAELLGTRPLPLRDLAVVTGVSVLGYAGIRLDRKLHPR